MATIQETLAIALRRHQAGQLQAAEQLYRQILAFQPSHADAMHLLGVLCAQTGRPALAIQYMEEAIRLQGNVAFYHYNLGEAYRASLRNSEAAASYRRAVELKPDYAEAHNNLGGVLTNLGKPNEAAECCRRALQLRPNLAEAHNNLGAALKEQGKLGEAAICYRRAVQLKPDYPEAHNNLGAALNDLGKPDEAVACYRRALELKPDYAETHTNLGIALEELGDLKGAERAFRIALTHNSRFALAHYKLAELLAGTLPEEDLAAQRRLLEAADLSEVQRSLLDFGLARVLDARGEYAEAAGRLQEANALQLAEWRKRGLEYDPQEHEAVIDQMISVCTPDFFQRAGGFGMQDLGPEGELPVFVVGLPRSGTTLIEQILASHSQVFAAGEIKLAGASMLALGGQRLEPVEGLRRMDRETARHLASRHLEGLRTLSATAGRIVDKMPDNYLLLGLLAALFPRATFIHCRRDLRDVAVSCWMTHFREVRWANVQLHIASRFQQYQRIMEHWRQVLPVPWLEVDYEETVASPETVARRLVAWCKLPWEPGCLEFYKARRPVRTASAVQVRQPVFQTSVGRWKHYEESLAALLGAVRGGKEKVDNPFRSG